MTGFRSARRGLLLHGDGGDLNLRVADEACDLDGGACGLGVGHELFVDLVHAWDVVEVRDVDGDVDKVGHLEAGLLDEPLDGGDGVGGLVLDGEAFKLALAGAAGGRSLLAGDVECLAGDDGVREGHLGVEVDGLVRLGVGGEGGGEQEGESDAGDVFGHGELLHLRCC